MCVPCAAQPAEPSQPAPSNRADAKAGDNNQATTQPPINITVTAPDPSPETAKRQEEREDRNVAAQENISEYTLALTILAFIQAGIGLAAFLVSIRAANAAKRSADIATEALHVTQRAHIALSHWSIEGLDTGQQPSNFSFVISNEGHTQGVVNKRYVRVTVATKLPDTPSYREDAATKVSLPVPPHHRMRQWVATSALSAQDLTGVLNGTAAFWLWGFVEYTDAFGKSHTNGFCVTYDLPSKTLRLSGPDGYNYAD